MKNNKLLVAAGATVMLLAGGAAFLVGQDKSGENNQDVNIVEASKVKVKETVEYGANLDDKSFVVNTKDGKEEFLYKDLNSTVDTMKLGTQEYKLTKDKKNIVIEITVKDTQKPVVEGVKEKITLKSDVDMEKQLSELIIAKDPVDGPIEVKFEIKPNGKEYDVVANATDKNGNTTSATFLVTIEKVANSDKPNSEDIKKENDKVASGSNPGVVAKPGDNVNSGTNTPSQPEKPAQKPETKPQPKPEQPAQKPETKPQPKPEQPAQKPETKPQPKPEQPTQKPAEPTKPAPKPEAKPQPKPEQPAKPAPKPETKPKPQPSTEYSDSITKITIVGSVPGAKKIRQSHGEIEYSFNKPLPGGGKINTVKMLGDENGEFLVSFDGVDKNGGAIFTLRNTKDTKSSYLFNYPAISNEAFKQIDEWATLFLKAHTK